MISINFSQRNNFPENVVAAFDSEVNDIATVGINVVCDATYSNDLTGVTKVHLNLEYDTFGAHQISSDASDSENSAEEQPQKVLLMRGKIALRDGQNGYYTPCERSSFERGVYVDKTSAIFKLPACFYDNTLYIDAGAFNTVKDAITTYSFCVCSDNTEQMLEKL